MAAATLVYGWYGHGNCGDESYKLTFPKIFPSQELVFSDTIPSPFNYDTLIMGGGDIVYSNVIQKIKNLKCKKYLISVSLTSCDCIEELKVFDFIAVRDQKSLDKLNANNIKAKLIPDLAFALTPNKKNGKLLLKNIFQSANCELYSKSIIVVINAHLCVKESLLAREEITFQSFIYDLAHVIDNTPASFIFVPFGTDQPHDDRIANSWMASKCKFWKKNVVIYEKYSPQMILDLFSAADMSICTRLHAGIFSIVGNTPFIDITHHDKTKDFMTTLGLDSWTSNYWNFDKNKIKDLISIHLSKNKHNLLDIDRQFKKELIDFIAQLKSHTPVETQT
jgi:polysaccharide pyruvyl transferase WcaK-like protein